jgi:hypothetical protein
VKTEGQRIFLKSYYENGVDGGGLFIGHIGTKLDDSGTVAQGVNYYWERVLGGITPTVEMFGCPNSATVDAGPYITLALGVVGEVRLQDRTYYVDSADIPSGSRIVSLGGAVIRPLTSNASAKFNLGSGREKIRFENIKFSDPAGLVTSEDALLINAESITGLTITNCTFEGLKQRCVRVRNGSGIKITDNKFRGSLPHSQLSDERSAEIYLVDTLAHVIVSNNQFYGADSGLWGSREIGVFVHAVTSGAYWNDVHIVSNYFENYRRFGIGVGTQDIGTLDQLSKNVWITENTIINSGQEGIKMKAGSIVHVDNNTVDGFEGIMAEVPDSLNGGIFMQINAESTCNGNRIYGKNKKLWSGAVTSATSTTVSLPTSNWTTYTISATQGSGVSTIAGKYVYISSGTGVGQWRRISSWNSTTKMATVNTAWTTVPDTTSVIEVYSNPSMGIKYRGNNTGVSTWADSRTARCFQSMNNYVEGCEVGFGLSEPLFNCQFGSLHAQNCRAILKTYSGTLKTTRGVQFFGLTGQYLDYPSTDNSSAITFTDCSQIEIHGLKISGSYYDGLRLSNVDNFKIFGGVVEGCGMGVSGRYGLAIAGGVTNFESHGVTYGGTNAGAGQSYAAFFQNTNSGISFFGGSMLGNVAGVFNPGSSGALYPPRDTVFSGVAGAGQIKGVTLVDNTSKVIIPGTDKDTVLFNTPLTAIRTVTFSTSFVEDGCTYTISRSAASTGSFALNVVTAVGTQALAVGSYLRVVYSSTLGWIPVSYGLLS